MKAAKTLLTTMLFTLVAAGPARAQEDYPNKPIRLIVPVPAGSSLDVRMRGFTQAVSQQTGWTIVIENKPGAGQSIGSAIAARSAPDGYTLLVVNNNVTINPYLQLNPGYDPFKSLVPITAIITAPLVLVVNPDSNIKSVKDLVAYAKSKPEGLMYAHSGLGSTPFFTAELFKKITGINAQEVAFKGDSEWLPQLMGGRVDFGFSGPPSVGPLAAAGKVRALGVTTNQAFLLRCLAHSVFAGGDATTAFVADHAAGEDHTRWHIRRDKRLNIVRHGLPGDAVDVVRGEFSE